MFVVVKITLVAVGGVVAAFLVVGAVVLALRKKISLQQSTRNSRLRNGQPWPMDKNVGVKVDAAEFASGLARDRCSVSRGDFPCRLGLGTQRARELGYGRVT